MLNKMYRNINHIVLPLLIGGAVMSACSDDLDIGAELTPGSSYIELTLDSNDIETRALSDTQTPFTADERALKNVDIFLYKTGANEATDLPVRVYNFTDKVHTDKVKIILQDEDVEAIFGDLEADGECIAFAVVNVDEKDYNGISKESATISQLKAITAHTASFAENFNGFAMFTKASGGDKVEYKFEDGIASGEIKLKNLAAKIDVFVSFTENISADGKTWNVAMSSGTPTATPTAEVHILNGVTAVKLVGGFDKKILTEDDYYSIRLEDEDDYRRGLAKLSSNDPYYENGKFLWASSAPYYSYPNSWETNPLEKRRTSLILKVDWVPSDNPTDVLTTYYNVPVALDVDELKSNHYYRLKLEINSLGGQHFGEPLELEGTWEVLDWGHALLEADIREIRYLEIARSEMNDKDEKTYTAVMNNTETTMIPYYTSHAVQIKSAKVTYRNIYYAGTDGTGIPTDVVIDEPNEIAAYTLTKEAYAAGQPGVYIDQVNHNIYVRNPLHPISLNNGRYTFDPNENKYAPFNIEIVLEHVDDPSTHDTITIIQYPPLYVEISPNDAKDLSESAWGWTTKSMGYTSVNDDTNTWGGVKGIADGWLSKVVGGILGETTNPNMYLITVTNLEASDAPLHLGDPRTKHIQTNLETPNNRIDRVVGVSLYTNDPLPLSAVDEGEAGWTVGNTPEWRDGRQTGVTRKLSYYYPTDETETDYAKYMVAPQFRISSSYGTQKTDITRNDARKRCATYQENGYPAGRWRLPTVGELQYIASLSQKKIIPPLFTIGEAYWSSHGAYVIENNKFVFVTDISNFWDWLKKLFGSNNVKGYVRCVYDDWYWTYKDSEGNDLPDNFSKEEYLKNKQLPSGFTDINKLKDTFHWGDKPKNNPQDQPDITTD